MPYFFRTPIKPLNLNDTFTMAGSEYTVKKGLANAGYFIELNEDVGNTDRIFKTIGVDKKEFQQEILGEENYPSPTGRFPFCNTLENLTKFVNAIDSMCLHGRMKSEPRLDTSPEPIKKDNRLNNFLLLNL
jgi:hypothetical protein